MTDYNSLQGGPKSNPLSFYRAMHFSAKRGIAIACRLSVRLSVCNVGGSGPHRLEYCELRTTPIVSYNIHS